MKRNPVASRAFKHTSFTLVELLVVIAIIAILAAVTLNVGSVIIKMAKRTKAANTATQIQTAVLGYYTEYSVYPVPSGTTGDYVITDTGTTQAGLWEPLIYALSGNILPASPTSTYSSTIANTRGIAFLSLKASDVDSTYNAPLNPLPTPSGTLTTNTYFNIAINSSYSGVLGTNSPSNVMPVFSGTGTSGTSTAGVAVWANCNASSTKTNLNFWVHTY